VRCSSEREALEDGLGYGRDFVNKDDTALKAREDFPATLPDDRALYAWPCPPFTHMRAFHPTELTLVRGFFFLAHRDTTLHTRPAPELRVLSEPERQRVCSRRHWRRSRR
jgi:hypothetical protein